MKTEQVDLLVIGAGPAGQKGAIQGAKGGLKVVVADRLGLLGGSCLNQGTVPSKALRQAILDMTGFIQSGYHGSQGSQHEISFDELRSRVNKVIEDENRVLSEQCEANDIGTAFGTARFTDEHVVEVTDEAGQVSARFEADKVLISTGSRPRHPIDLPEEPDLFLDSDEIFRMNSVPKSLIVLGGGIIGCEYATMFAALGIEVILMDRRDDLLRMLDLEISQAFADYIQQMAGLSVRLGEGIDALRKSADGRAEVVLKEGGSLVADRLFYSMGRIANVDGLGLDKAGIELDKLGNIPVNALFQTTQPHIYAAGDVIGPPALASTSVEQGRLAIRNALMIKSHHFPEFFPYGIYTIPEISSVGPTEEELKNLGVHYEVGRALYSEMARGPIAGDTQGMIKLIFHAQTLEMLAVHIIGTMATELIPIGQMAINLRVKADYFVDTIFNYPTFAEGYRIAALNGLNRLEGPGTAKWS
jgi:NAD(P) transhydrogenase